MGLPDPPPDADEAFEPPPDPALPPRLVRGRGAMSNDEGRFSAWSRQREDDGWLAPGDDAPEGLATELIVDTARSVIARNQSPDVPFDQSINPYKGCEHGCIYCFARPTHAYLGLSPGLDFETRIAYKPDAPERLREELARPGYRCSPIALGVNTDGWQPVERRLGLTRRILALLAECHHPVSIVTKSALIERDLDLLAPMAKDNLVQVMFSVTTLDADLARRLEPRAPAPERRLQAMARLAEAGVPVGVLVAPLIPALNDHELEAVLKRARDAGAESAGYILLRLPHEVSGLFREWLGEHAPGRATHVINLIRQMRGGKDYDARFGSRMRGQGPYAEMLSQRLRTAARKLGLNKMQRELARSLFRPPCPARPATDDAQLDLF